MSPFVTAELLLKIVWWHFLFFIVKVLRWRKVNNDSQTRWSITCANSYVARNWRNGFSPSRKKLVCQFRPWGTRNKRKYCTMRNPDMLPLIISEFSKRLRSTLLKSNFFHFINPNLLQEMTRIVCALQIPSSRIWWNRCEKGSTYLPLKQTFDPFRLH